MTAVFLQARLDSSRLPRKALLRLGDRTVVEHAMRALDAVPADARWLVTSEDSAGELGPYAEACGWGLFAGPKDDVLKRFVQAARKAGARRIVRATGDNPLVSGAMAARSLELAERTGAAYAGYRGLPLGCGVEVIDAASLAEADAEAVDPYEREHVAPFLYRRPERYRIETPEAPGPWRLPDARVTLDTEEDFRYLTGLFEALYDGSPVELPRLVPYLSETHRNAG